MFALVSDVSDDVRLLLEQKKYRDVVCLVRQRMKMAKTPKEQISCLSLICLALYYNKQYEEALQCIEKEQLPLAKNFHAEYVIVLSNRLLCIYSLGWNTLMLGESEKLMKEAEKEGKDSQVEVDEVCSLAKTGYWRAVEFRQLALLCFDRYADIVRFTKPFMEQKLWEECPRFMRPYICAFLVAALEGLCDFSGTIKALRLFIDHFTDAFYPRDLKVFKTQLAQIYLLCCDGHSAVPLLEEGSELGSARRARADRPFARLHANRSTRVCAHCTSVGSHKRCPCLRVWYCGKECQKAHWKAGHREECAPLEENPCIVCLKGGCTELCSTCKKVHYCGAACQKADWPSHKALCNEWREEAPIPEYPHRINP